ncbi:MAG: chemotaxis protein CheW [Fibrobacterales bacterium]
MEESQLETSKKYLTFQLDKEIYALEITRVREVLDYIKITKVPQMPGFMCGVINLRGGVVPVVDLRTKFGLKQPDVTPDTCIIIIEIVLDNEQTLIGAVADTVQEVIEFENSLIEPAPKLGTRLNTEFILGMAKKDDEFIIILDINKVFSNEEFLVLSDADQKSSSSEQQ